LGRAVFDEGDYTVRLELRQPEVGFVRAGFEMYRKYFDNSGGYYAPFTPSYFTLDEELELDVGRVYAEIGLTRPDLPQLVVGYERQFKNGSKSLLEWGAATQGLVTRRIVPSVKDIDQTVDIIKATASYTLANVNLADDFRYEHYRSETKRRDTSVDLNANTSKTVTVREEYRHDAFYNTFRMDSQLNEKTYWSLGYLYNTLTGEGGLDVMTPPPLAPFDRNWTTESVDLDLDSQVLNLNLLVGPFGGLSGYLGVQGEATDTDGATDALLTDGLGPTTTNLIRSKRQKDSLEETIGLRFTRLPYTTLYAEGQFTQQQIDLREQESEDALSLFARRTDTCVLRQRYTVGLNSSPWRRVSLGARYRHSINSNDYDHDLDTTAGYPAFIDNQEFTTDELTAKLTLRPWSRLQMTLQYQLVATDVRTRSDAIPLLAPGGELQTANYDSSIYSVSATVTPLSRLYLMGLFSYQDTRTVTFANHNPGVLSYDGSVWSVLAAAGYAVANNVDLTVQYNYSRCDDYTNYEADGLPLGLDSQRQAVTAGLRWRINEQVQARLRYGFYSYNETSNGGIDDFVANLVAASCTIQF